MKSIKNHFSLIVALFAILFSIQVLIINDRAINAYQEKLASDYSLVVVSNTSISNQQFKSYSPYIASSKELSAEKIISKLQKNISEQNIQLLKLSMPKFYQVKLNHYPTPYQIKLITQSLFNNPNITKVQDFSQTYHTTFRLLLLLKTITQIFTLTIFIITILLIAKEMRIWQLKHKERMNIMGLFGAPVWLRSAVLFRLAIVDALIASAITDVLFYVISQTRFIKYQLSSIGINIKIFMPVQDSVTLIVISTCLSIILASIIVIGYKEEI